MCARVLITDGSRTIDLFWVHHDGKDVYCGFSKIDDKRTYHASGKIHSTFAGIRRDEGWHTPLKNLKGHFQLTGINVGNIGQWMGIISNNLEYSGKKSDTVLFVDTRSIPQDVETHISLGLLEPKNGKVMSWLLGLPFNIDGEEFKPQMGLFATSVSPWVYATVYWWRKKVTNSAATPSTRERNNRG
jgi:hypothetical protein